MSKTILIVESDSDHSQSMRSELEGRGFAVEETQDGKGSLEKIRSTRPDLVVLAVELAAGQNGYIICGKLKKDDDLKAVPVVIVGNPDGFAAHRKLKTHADEYVAKPVDLGELVERIGGLIGLPEVTGAGEVMEESLTLDDLVSDDEPMSTEEISVDAGATDEATVSGDPDLDRLDDAFADMTGGSSGSADDEPVALEEEQVTAPPEEELALDGLGEDSSEDEALAGLGFDGEDEKTQIGYELPKAAAPAPSKPAPYAAKPSPAPRRRRAAPRRRPPRPTPPSSASCARRSASSSRR